MKKWKCAFYFSFVDCGMQFSTELEYIYFELDEKLDITNAEFYISGIIQDLYKFKNIEPQLTMYCYENRNDN